MSDLDLKYMQAALKLAGRGIGTVEPNPAVGCVIVKANQVIGRGWHKKFGDPHAEINAIEDCKSHGVDPRGATMYVTLEPCCHQGKTPPCADAIIAAGLSRVVAATIDPSEHAVGKGIRQLANAGIEIQTGVCQEQAMLLNAPFIKFAKTGKTWVVLKWAQTIDGKLAWARNSDEQRWISNESSRKDAHKLRRRVQGILVGIETVLADDPILTPRPAKGKKPLRIILDTNLRIPLTCKLLATAGRSDVIIVTSRLAAETNPSRVQKIEEKKAQLLYVPTVDGRCDLRAMLNELGSRGVQQLLVEGGASVIASFLKQKLADEVCVYIAPEITGSRGSVSIADKIEQLDASAGLHYVDIKRFGDDVRISGLTERLVKFQ